MRLGLVAETPLEWLALRLGRVPTPLVDTQLAFALARSVMAAARLGVFEAIAAGADTAEAVAGRCGTATAPTERLLHALVGVGYLRPARAPGTLALSRLAARWLVRSSRHEVVDKVLFAYDEWRYVEGYETYLRSGRSVDLHRALDATGGAAVPRATDPAGAEPSNPAAPGPEAHAWARYQRGLHAVARVSSAEVGRRTPVPRGARWMVDLGGAHGAFAAAILRRHPRLRAEVLDLAPAVRASASLLAAEGLGDRLRHRVGDALAADLGRDVDVVFGSQFHHHLDEAANVALAARVAAALRPGGVYVIQDLARPADPREARRARLGALLDLYFGATSGAGTYSVEQMRRWQADAGLRPLRTAWLRTLPGLVQQAAVRVA